MTTSVFCATNRRMQDQTKQGFIAVHGCVDQGTLSIASGFLPEQQSFHLDPLKMKITLIGRIRRITGDSSFAWLNQHLDIATKLRDRLVGGHVIVGSIGVDFFYLFFDRKCNELGDK